MKDLGVIIGMILLCNATAIKEHNIRRRKSGVSSDATAV